jgi:hypothetical protein
MGHIYAPGRGRRVRPGAASAAPPHGRTEASLCAGHARRRRAARAARLDALLPLAAAAALLMTAASAPVVASTAAAAAARRRATCDWRLVQQNVYSSLGDLPSLGLSSGESICWGGHWCGAGNRLSLTQFVMMNASTVRSLMGQPHPNSTAPVTRNVTSMIILDIEQPVPYSDLHKMNDTLLAAVVAAVRLRVRTAQELFPYATVALYNQRMDPDSTAALKGYHRASLLGMYDEVSHLVPVLYLKGGDGA